MTIYIAHSRDADLKFAGGTSQSALYKFGHTSRQSPRSLAKRFNHGFGKGQGIRTPPLALCQKWIILSTSPGEKKIEGEIFNVIDVEMFRFAQKEDVLREIRAMDGPGKVLDMGNGIGEIRLIGLHQLPLIECRIAARVTMDEPARKAIQMACVHLAANRGGAVSP